MAIHGGVIRRDSLAIADRAAYSLVDLGRAPFRLIRLPPALRARPLTLAPPPPRPVFRPDIAGATCRLLVVLVFVSLGWIGARANPWRGAPLSRFYPFDEIRGISAGAGISFDAFGRVVLVQNGTYLVLNDERWMEDLARSARVPPVRHVLCDTRGDSYFVSVGSWGRLVRAEDGALVPVSLLPDSCPDWVRKTDFTQIASSSAGVCFGGWIGVVFRERQTGRTTCERVSGLARVFELEDRIYVSSHERGVRQLDVATGALLEPEQNAFGGLVVEQVAKLGDSAAIVSTSDRRLLKYEGGRVAPLPGLMGREMEGRITALAAQPDGTVAVAVLGAGLYLIGGDGEVRLFLSDIEYRDIKAMAANEGGVLWAVTPTGLVKILTRFPFTRFKQTNGLPVFWPQFLAWRGRLLVASNGHLYESSTLPTGAPASFQWVSGQPRSGVWGVASFGDWLLLGNRDGVFARNRDGLWEPVLQGIEVARLAMLDAGVCFAIGMERIAVLKLGEDGRWRECAPRVAGIGYPSLVHVSRQAAWMEIGANVVGRISLEDDRIKAEAITEFPWQDPRWIHVSVVGGTTILSGPEGGRLYFDEATRQFRDNAEIESLLAGFPGPWPARVAIDGPDSYWVSHAQGISHLRAVEGRFVEDDTRFGSLDCCIPQIHRVSGGAVFLSTGSEVFALERPLPGEPVAPRPFRPQVVATVDSSAGGLLFPGGGFVADATLPYEKNSFSLRLFAGSYAARRSPQYEFSVNGASWERLDGSVLPMTNIREGRYRVEVRLVDRERPVGRSLELGFSIDPPWWRTPLAYALYGIAAAFAAGLGVAFVTWRVRRRNLVLEGMVREKTSELERTMQQLEQEARTSATLAERNRLAGEIHDTLEQSLSALALQLSSTAGHSDCSAQVRKGLAIAQNMVVFSRDEVRNAVWDLHSPSVGDAGIVGALERLVAQLVPPQIKAVVAVEGERRSVGAAVEHHLLRIAQEAVANAVKHARATSIVITVRYGAGEVSLVVRDDGHGFAVAVASALPAGHFGLRFMRGRAEKIGGKVEVSSTAGAGTCITVVVPTPN